MLKPLNDKQRKFIEKYRSKAKLTDLEYKNVGYILDRDEYDPFPYSQDMALITKIIERRRNEISKQRAD